MIVIGSGIESGGFDTTSSNGPVRVYLFPGGVARLHGRHAAIVRAAFLVRDTAETWDAPVFSIAPQEPQQLTAGEPPEAA